MSDSRNCERRTVLAGSRPIESMKPEAAREHIRALLLELTEHIGFAMHCLATGDKVSNKVKFVENGDVIKTIYFMIDALRSSTKSIIKLTDTFDMGIRDCFGIARSISESAINVCYIIAAGDEAASLARRHALQKNYRTHSRKERIGTLDIGGDNLPDVDDIPGLKEALADFTRKNGLEIKNWTTLSLDDKRRFIVDRFPRIELLTTSTIAMYSDASEILHGTFYGVQYFLDGFVLAPPTQTEFERTYVENYLTAIFSAVWASVNAMLEVIGTEFGIHDLMNCIRAWLEKAAALYVATAGGSPICERAP